MADDGGIFGNLFSFNLFEETLSALFGFQEDPFEEYDEYEDDYDLNFVDPLEFYPISDFDKVEGIPKEFITWEQIQTLLKSANPTVTEAITNLIEEIDSENMTLDEIDTLVFARPVIGRTVIDPDTGLPTFRDTLVGVDDDFDSMENARLKLDEKVDAPAGGGGSSGSFYISEITSDQWQRIRRGDISEAEAKWENDEDNYDEYGDLREFETYAEDDEDEGED